MHKRLLIGLIGAAGLGTAVGCNLDQLSAQKVMVGYVLGTPAIDMTSAALAGFDGGGDYQDAGITFDAGQLVIPPETVTFAFFGTRGDQGLTVAPTGLDDAGVTLQPGSGAVSVLKPQGAGSYLLTSLDDSSLKYQPGATYDFTATYAGENFVGEVSPAPDVETISEFHPASPGYIVLTAGSTFTFHRPDPPANVDRNIGFVSVIPVSGDGKQGGPTYTNIPNTPLGLLKLIAAPGDFKQSVVTIPGSAFPAAQQTYVIVFQSVKNGGPKSNNLFTGSALLAGTADVGVVRTSP